MPVGRFQDQAFMGFVENKLLFTAAVVVMDTAGAAQANGSLYRLFMPVAAANGTIDPVNIKNAVNGKRYAFFYNG
jgi:hypothetical protein